MDHDQYVATPNEWIVDHDRNVATPNVWIVGHDRTVGADPGQPPTESRGLSIQETSQGLSPRRRRRRLPLRASHPLGARLRWASPRFNLSDSTAPDFSPDHGSHLHHDFASKRGTLALLPRTRTRTRPRTASHLESPVRSATSRLAIGRHASKLLGSVSPASTAISTAAAASIASPRDAKHACTVCRGYSPRGFRDVECCTLRSAHRLITELYVAYLGGSDNGEELESHGYAANLWCGSGRVGSRRSVMPLPAQEP